MALCGGLLSYSGLDLSTRSGGGGGGGGRDAHPHFRLGVSS